MRTSNSSCQYTNTKGQPFFGWPFLLVDLVLDLRRYRFKDLSGANLNVRLLHDPEGVSLMNETNNSRIYTAPQLFFTLTPIIKN